MIILKWPLFPVAGQLERLIFRLSWSLKLFMVSKTKAYFSTNLKNCQLPSSCLRLQYPKSYDICWLQCVSRSLRGCEIISYSLLHMSSLRNCPLKCTQPLESFKDGGLFQLHRERSAGNDCAVSERPRSAAVRAWAGEARTLTEMFVLELRLL